MFIRDLFFLHEHARKINIWSGFIVVSPYMGPLLAAFIVNTQIWQWAFGLYAIETSLCLIAIILFVEETYYDRKTAQPELAARGQRWQRMLGIQQLRTRYIENSFKDAIMRPVIIICKPVVFTSVVYYMLTFAWVVGINTTLSILLTPVYHFGPKQIGTCFPICPSTSIILTNPTRILLLYSRRSSTAWRNSGSLAARLHRQSLHDAPQRSSRARSAPYCDLGRNAIHDRRYDPYGLRSRTPLSLHACGTGLGLLRVRDHDRHRGDQLLRPGLISRGQRRGRCVGEFRAYDRWVCRVVFHGRVGTETGDDSADGRDGWDHRRGILHCACPANLGEEATGMGRPCEVQNAITGHGISASASASANNYYHRC